MTIETGPVPTGSKSSGVSHATGAKGKTDAAGKSNAGVPIGFMAVLAAMDTTSVAVEPVTADSETLPVSGEASTTTGPAAMTGMPFLSGFNFASAAPLSTNAEGVADLAGADTAPPGPTLAGADSSMGTVPVPPALSSADVVSTVSMDPAALVAQSLQAVAAPTEQRVGTTDDTHASTSIEGVPAGTKPVRAAATPAGVPASRDFTGDTAPEAVRKIAGKPSDASARQAPSDAMQTNLTKSSVQSDAKAQDFIQRVSSPQATSVALELAVANTASPSRREEHMSERSIFKPGGTETTYAQQQPATELAVNAPVVGSSDAVSPTDTFVAEQISYWISNDVQNAEMKLDGIGDTPVGVSISMHGNEAHVTFRTDELQAREALENASLHLKDLLQREGLVLAGVSVGTSGAGDSGGQEHRPRQGAKVATVVPTAVRPMDRHPVQGGVAGRALDLFV